MDIRQIEITFSLILFFLSFFAFRLLLFCCYDFELKPTVSERIQCFLFFTL